MAQTEEQIAGWRGHEVVGDGDEKIGKIDEIYLDQQTGKPEWLAVKTGMFGGKLSFVPLAEAHPHGDTIHVPYGKDQVKDAPNAEPDGELSQEEEAGLYKHYGLDYSESTSDSGLPQGESREGGPGEDVSGENTDSAMTRSEEELRVGTRRQESGKVRLKKYVVTENVTKTVPVQREEVRIEREPITEANMPEAMDGPAISEEEHEVTLHEEVPVVDKVAVPKERIRADVDTTRDEQQVSDEVRKEQIEVEDDGKR